MQNNYVDMRPIYVSRGVNYVSIEDIYVDMRVNIQSIYVNMQYNYVNMQVIHKKMRDNFLFLKKKMVCLCLHTSKYNRRGNSFKFKALSSEILNIIMFPKFTLIKARS